MKTTGHFVFGFMIAALLMLGTAAISFADGESYIDQLGAQIENDIFTGKIHEMVKVVKSSKPAAKPTKPISKWEQGLNEAHFGQFFGDLFLGSSDNDDTEPTGSFIFGDSVQNPTGFSVFGSGRGVSGIDIDEAGRTDTIDDPSFRDQVNAGNDANIKTDLINHGYNGNFVREW